jgi:hypothetical protein
MVQNCDFKLFRLNSDNLIVDGLAWRIGGTTAASPLPSTEWLYWWGLNNEQLFASFAEEWFCWLWDCCYRTQLIFLHFDDAGCWVLGKPCSSKCLLFIMFVHYTQANPLVNMKSFWKPGATVCLFCFTCVTLACFQGISVMVQLGFVHQIDAWYRHNDIIQSLQQIQLEPQRPYQNLDLEQ